MKKFFICALFLNFLCIDSQLIPEICKCDLTYNFCDLLCCCDKNCTELDLKAFNCDKNQTEIVPRRYCVPSNQLFITNVPYIIQIAGQLFCVIDEAEFLLPENPEQYNLEENVIAALVNQINPFSFIKNKNYFDETQPFFKVTDRIWIIFEDNTIGYLSLPNQYDRNCNKRLPVNYLTNKNTYCNIFLNSSLSFKNNDFAIELIDGIKNFKIIQRPDTLKVCRENFNSSFIDYYQNCSSNLTTVNLRNCYFNGTILLNINGTLCDIKNFVENQKYRISSINYVFEYLNPIGITKANLDVYFLDSGINELFYRQDFRIFFLKGNQNFETKEDTQLMLTKLSGNPGYILGEPILAGFWDSVNLTIPSNRNVWLTAVTSSLSCQDDSNSRISIKFGTNLITECIYTLPENPSNENDLKITCENLQKNILLIILGNSDTFKANYVASFGNLINSQNLTDWVEIINSTNFDDAVITSSLNPATCNLLTDSLSIEIAFAFVGNSINPQKKILKVFYNWNEEKRATFVLKCYNKNIMDCKDKIKISTRVTFVDVSLNSEYVQARLYQNNIRFPGDFFSPFFGSNKALKSQVSFYSIIFLLAFSLVFS